MTTTCLLASKVQQYRNGFVSPINNKIGVITSPSSTDIDKALGLLIGDVKWYVGCHQWYLKLYPSVKNQMINDIIRRKLWNIPLNKYNSFEDIYKDIRKWFSRNYIGQVTIYDITLRLLVARNEVRLYPKDYVYVHARPAKAYKDLVAKGYISRKLRKQNDIIPIKEFRNAFGNLESYDIEDMLCQIGKGNIIIEGCNELNP